jgi:hypothetical protein
MKTLSKRLEALEGGQGSEFSLWSDAQLINRMNELTVQLRPYGLDFPLLDGGPDDVERLRVTHSILAQSKELYDGIYQATH